ncbi:MAG: tRNA-guanosine(34) transglycosylase [Proteobacteria bacterium]|nr:tRNA-guanosine(34) transglycosylase [Pseudomonadota bacterium]
MISAPVVTEQFKFEILYQSKISRARVGKIHTPHGIIDTPNFVAVGTNGSLKTLHNHDHQNLNVQLMFCNTYHLMVQPGTALIKEAGGLHRFIHRHQPIITDSGGFQVFSLAYAQAGLEQRELKGQGGKKHANSVVKVSEDGVIFRSYKDGRKILLSPETTVLAQKDLGSDIIIPLDELLPFHVDEQKLKASFDRTHRWECRSLHEHLKNRQNQAMYAVVHGGSDLALREKSCAILTNEAFDGFAIGGALGSDHQELYDTVKGTTVHLPIEAPVHLLGIGDVASIDKCIEYGIDTFDSSYPTKAARHGMILTREGPLKLIRTLHAKEFIPLDEGCQCQTCTHYSRAYLHHLFKANEPSAASLATQHNVHFMMQKMENIRTQIMCGLI